MTALGDYRLLWAAAGSGGGGHAGCAGDGDDPAATCDQYVFDTTVDMPTSLRRARTFADLLQALSGGGRESTERLAVALVALLVGNMGYLLGSMGRWDCLLGFLLIGLLCSICELRAAENLGATALVCLLPATLAAGGVSARWLATVSLTVLLTLLVLIVTTLAVKEDPRGHVLLLEEEGEATVLRNHCCMDVKLLVFDDGDVFQLVPRGGLLGGTLLARGEAHQVGPSPPYVVKAYAPWEREIGSWRLRGGSYGLRATAPPLLTLPSDRPLFANRAPETVVICACRTDSWTHSLWVPLAPLLARLASRGQLVPPGAEVPLSAAGLPCALRAYPAGPLRGLWSALASRQSCCVVRPGERVEYLGRVRWSNAAPKVRRSTSCMGSASSARSSGALLDKVH